jgi:hypothetical protein
LRDEVEVGLKTLRGGVVVGAVGGTGRDGGRGKREKRGRKQGRKGVSTGREEEGEGETHEMAPQTEEEEESKGKVEVADEEKSRRMEEEGRMGRMAVRRKGRHRQHARRKHERERSARAMRAPFLRRVRARSRTSPPTLSTRDGTKKGQFGFKAARRASLIDAVEKERGKGEKKRRTVRVEVADFFLKLLREDLPILLVVQRLIDAQFLLQPLALLLPSRDGDDLAAVKFRELAGEGTDGAGSARDDYSLAGLDLGDIEKTPVGRLRVVKEKNMGKRIGMSKAKSARRRGGE